MRFVWVLVAFLITAVAPHTYAADQKNAGILSLAVVNSFGQTVSDEYYEKTIETIRKAIAPMKLAVHRYSQKAYLEAAKEKKFDLSLASSGLSSVMMKRFGGTPLLSMVTAAAPDPAQGTASAFIARSGRNDIRSPEDLAGKTVAVMSRNAFAGYQIPVGELKRQGYDLNKMVGRFDIVEASMADVFKAVKDGRADVGFVAACLKENLERKGVISPGDFQTVLSREHPGFYCEHSSGLYPSWILSAAPRISPDTARRIVLSLLNMEADLQTGTKWTVVTDFAKIRQLFDTLKLDVSGERGWGQFIAEKRWYFVSVLAVFLGAVLNCILLAGTVRKKTREAEAAVNARMQSELDNVRNLARIESMEKATAIGIVSSMLAHEIRQPLTVIANYSSGLLRRAEKGNCSPEILKEAVREIAGQSERASDIIELVRSYGKKKKRAFGIFNLTPVLQSVSEILRKGTRDIQIKTILPPKLLVEADPLEIELVFLNLMKNAGEAVSQVSKPQILLWAKEDGSDVRIFIEDNGPRISDEVFETMTHFGRTTKKEGTGFGLPIVRQLLEAHGGALKIDRKSDPGLICMVKLPLSCKQHCEDVDACE